MKPLPKIIIAGAVCFACLISPIWADTHYVDINNATPSAPYTSWATAATVIQDAIDAASSNDTVRVADGTYDTGGAPVDSIDNRIALTKAIVVESSSGLEHTFIFGGNAMRCYVTNGATLSGFTLTNGLVQISNANTQHGGGGVLLAGGMLSYCKVINNKVVGDNEYEGDDGLGGGIYCLSNSTVQNCTIRGNQAYGGDGGRSD